MSLRDDQALSAVLLLRCHERHIHPQQPHHDWRENKRSPRRGPRASGADDGIRTRDLNLGKVALYQLSHIRTSSKNLAV